MERTPELGQAVKWHDPKGVEHDAIVTAVWNPTLINLVVVSKDENKRDEYGRQIERHTSQQHASKNRVHGFYWRFADEVANPYVAPAAV
ncbi:MAG: hypothetical protein ACRDGM_20570 [bacterium]